MKIIYTRPDGGVSILAIADQSAVAKTNPAVAAMTEAEFIDWVVAKDVPADATNVQVVQDNEVPPQAAVIPSQITMRQARLSLLHFGYLTQVSALIDSAPNAEQAKIDWEFSSIVRRDHPLVAYIAANLPLTEAQLDELLTFGAAL